MKKQYVVKDLETGLFCGAITCGWTEIIALAYKSEDIEDAERIISQRHEKGYFVIETVYLT